MSIISEALKKAQDSRINRTITPAAPAVPAPAIKHSTEPRVKFPVKNFLILALIAVLGGFAYFYYPALSNVIIKSDAAVVESAITENIPRPTPIFAKKLPELTGIMYSKPSPCALINGKLVNEGFTYGDFTVQEIQPDRVILLSDGQQYELKMR